MKDREKRERYSKRNHEQGIKQSQKKSIDNARGITIVVLVVTIVVLIILGTVTINAVFGENGLIKQAQDTKGATENSIEIEEDESNRVYEEYANVMAEDKEIPIAGPQDTPEPEEGGAEFIMSYGVIEIKWLQGNTNYVSSTPNAPKVKSISNGTMELVKYDEASETWVAVTEYSYVSVIGIGDNNASKWANARVTIDGIESYFVWIPRYAYRIVYFNSEASKNEYKEVTINNSSSYITGNAGNSISDEEASGTTNAYNTEKGGLASSTGNVYGIYDFSGGTYEYIAIYYNGNDVDKEYI